MNPKASLSVLILACGLLAAFFMPWIHIWFGSISGYELARLASSNGDHLPEGVIYIWIIPVLAVATIGLSFVTNNRPIGVVTGLVPLLGLAYMTSQMMGNTPPRGAPDNIFQILPHLLAIGGYLVIICSVGLIAVAIGNSPSRSPTASSRTRQ